MRAALRFLFLAHATLVCGQIRITPVKVEGIPEGIGLSNAASNGDSVIAGLAGDHERHYQLDIQASEPRGL
jgi:hypothetical protein